MPLPTLIHFFPASLSRHSLSSIQVMVICQTSSLESSGAWFRVLQVSCFQSHLAALRGCVVPLLTKLSLNLHFSQAWLTEEILNTVIRRTDILTSPFTFICLRISQCFMLWLVKLRLCLKPGASGKVTVNYSKNYGDIFWLLVATVKKMSACLGHGGNEHQDNVYIIVLIDSVQ